MCQGSEMIYTITLNPAIDHVIELPDFQTGALNRVHREYLFPGGKGVNVSLILTELGTKNTALGFLAGVTGKAYEALLQDKQRCQFEWLQNGFTRINAKVSARNETEINGRGPVITERDLDHLCMHVADGSEENTVVLSGSVPDHLPGAYRYILERLADTNSQFVVDTAGQELLETLALHPFLIKPNRNEIEELFTRKLPHAEDVINCAGQLQKSGARNVLVSMGDQGALLLTETGELYCAEGIPGTVKNSVGAGDAMVAGFLADWGKHHSYETALRLGTAAGTATAFSFGLAHKEEIAVYEQQVTVRKL